MGEKTDCIGYRGISLLPTTYEIYIASFLSRLTPYAEEITGNHQCGFRRKRSTTDHIFYICKYLRKNGKIISSSDFKKAYESVIREVSYNILIQFGIPMKW
jgi:hypothetical protein